jgi:hypothetical protein
MNMTDVPNAMLSISMMTKPNSPFFKYAKRRLGDLSQRDAEQAYLRYLEPALRSIHFSKPIHDARDILEYKVDMPSPEGGEGLKPFSLFATRYPNAYKYWTEYLNRLSGKRNMLDKMFPKPAALLGVTNRLFSAGSIAGNISSVLIQPASITNTIAETGLFALKGQLLINTPKWYRFAMNNSRIMKGRQYEPAHIENRLLGSKMLAKGHNVLSSSLSVPVSLMDKEMVGGAFLSGYFKGKALGLSEEDAIRYADDVCERTQASANKVDRPPINVGNIKVAIGQFQTFIYNQYSQIKKDMLRLGIKGEHTYQEYGEGLSGLREGRGTGLKRLMGFIISLIALDAVYEKLGLQSPFKQERAGTTKNKVLNKAIEYGTNVIPGLSSVRFGGSPAIKLGLSLGRLAVGTPQDKAKASQDLKALSSRLIPGGGQARKTLSMINAMANKGKVTSRSGKTVNFNIKDKSIGNIAKGYALGVYQTKEGQKFLDELTNPKEKSGKIKIGSIKIPKFKID